MKIIKQTYEIIWNPGRELAYQCIERAGRTCYKSEDKITPESSAAFVKMLMSRDHQAMIEFAPDIIVKFTTDRGVSHELVRHRIASFAQESTRYCNYSKDKFGNELTFIEPTDLLPKRSWKYLAWKSVMKASEMGYLALIKMKMSPQWARSVLPNSLKTEICVKMNFRELKHFFRLRTSPAAHPQMRELIEPFFNQMKEEYPEIFAYNVGS